MEIVETQICTECNTEKSIDSFRKDKRGKNGKEAKCKKCRREYSKKYYEGNKNYYKEYHKKWTKDNPEKVKLKDKKHRDKSERRKYLLEYKRSRKKEDPLYKLKDNIRNNIRCSFHNKGYSKKSTTRKIIGIDFPELLKHLNDNKFGFKVGDINIDLDHIIPLSSANSEDELIKLNHYTNLQLLPSSYNQHIKRDKPFNKNHFDKWFKIY